MLDEANRNGVTFYPIDIRGLPVEGTMNRRGDSLITMATATDGIAVIDSNAFTPALQRINEDLSLVLPARLLPEQQRRRTGRSGRST